MGRPMYFATIFILTCLTGFICSNGNVTTDFWRWQYAMPPWLRTKYREWQNQGCWALYCRGLNTSANIPCLEQENLSDCTYMSVIQHKTDFIRKAYKEMWMKCMQSDGKVPMIGVQQLGASYDTTFDLALECGWRRSMRFYSQVKTSDLKTFFVDAFTKAQNLCEVSKSTQVRSMEIDSEMNTCVKKVGKKFQRKKSPQQVLAKLNINANHSDYENLYFKSLSMHFLAKHAENLDIFYTMFEKFDGCYESDDYQETIPDYDDSGTTEYVHNDNDKNPIVRTTETVNEETIAGTDGLNNNTDEPTDTVEAQNETGTTGVVPAIEPSGAGAGNSPPKTVKRKRSMTGLDYADYDSNSDFMSPEEYARTKVRAIKCAYLKSVTRSGSDDDNGTYDAPYSPQNPIFTNDYGITEPPRKDTSLKDIGSTVKLNWSVLFAIGAGLIGARN